MFQHNVSSPALAGLGIRHLTKKGPGRLVKNRRIQGPRRYPPAQRGSNFQGKTYFTQMEEDQITAYCLEMRQAGIEVSRESSRASFLRHRIRKFGS